jgi:hypothetical protein
MRPLGSLFEASFFTSLDVPSQFDLLYIRVKDYWKLEIEKNVDKIPFKYPLLMVHGALIQKSISSHSWPTSISNFQI